jgi:two-component system CheB/CheR fusion protein
MKQENTNEFLIVALGASAGGLEPLETFFKQMPADAGFAFVIIQHLAPDHPTALPQLLARQTRMPVEEARDRTRVLPNQVYVIPPNATLTIENGAIRVTAPIAARGARTPIDAFFKSLAEDHGENAVCIMLSGTGTDGTLGLRAIKEHGGMAMAQSLESAKYDAILRSAIGTGLVDHVLPVEKMPAKLQEYAAHLASFNANSNAQSIRDEVGSQMGTIHTLLRRRIGHDFSQYKESTVARRLERRMRALQIDTVEEYVEQLKCQPEEADRLFNDLLIGVTQFFRDPEAFEALAREVIPKIFVGKDTGDQVRACVVGCASGEEAYSIAILLWERAATLNRAPKMQIFATDIDEQGLATARKGRYPDSIVEQVNPERLERFFTKQESAWQVNRELREMCLFSSHSFIRDPPFSRLDLISCRNVMIYLGQELQRKMIPLFHYALRPDGYLFLGPSENALSHGELFGTVDKKHRIFQRKETRPRPAVEFPLADIGRAKLPVEKLPESEERELSRRLERVILQRYRPACVAVKENGDAVYFSGRLSRYLEQPTGSPDANVVNMAREGLRVPLRAALHRAVATRERVVHKLVSVQTNGSLSQVDITVEPILEFQAANLYMIVFEDAAPATMPPLGNATVSDAGSGEAIRHLEDELRAAQEHAQAIFEELESSNEELQSANEEYQSTNEELETSKEELQSFNEELGTVNSELNRRVEELDHANSDLQNLLASTHIATVFLDRELRIKTFTPAAGSVFRLIAGDVGRPITDLAAQFTGLDPARDVKHVLETLTERERQLTGTGGRHYQLRILPYRTVKNVIDGVVLTFTDVTQLKEANQQAQDAEAFSENIIRTVREPLVVLDGALCVDTANQSFYDVFQVSPADTLGKLFYELGDGQWDIPDLRLLLGEVLPQKKALLGFQVEHAFPLIGEKTMLLNAREILQREGEKRLVLLAIEDITERSAAEKSQARLAAIVESSDDAIISNNLDGMITSWNKGAQRLFGYSAEEATGRPVSMLIANGREDEYTPILERIRYRESIDRNETVARRKDGSLVDISLSVSPILDEHGKIIGASRIARDITESRRAEQERLELAATERALVSERALRETEAELARVVRALSVGELATSIAHEVNQPLAGVITNAEAGIRWLSGKTPDINEALESLALIVRDGNRASNVIRHIRDFVKKESRQTPSLDINEVVQEAIALAATELQKREIGLHADLFEGIPLVRGDRIQLQQVILNLMMNGAEAIATASPGGSRELLVTSRKSADAGVVVSVRDSGGGIKPEDLHRIFDSFFTTKTEGMGMGLSISRSIVEAHGGQIQAEANHDGPGLTVQFTLPAETEPGSSSACQ